MTDKEKKILDDAIHKHFDAYVYYKDNFCRTFRAESKTERDYQKVIYDTLVALRESLRAAAAEEANENAALADAMSTLKSEPVKHDYLIVKHTTKAIGGGPYTSTLESREEVGILAGVDTDEIIRVVSELCLRVDTKTVQYSAERID